MVPRETRSISNRDGNAILQRRGLLDTPNLRLFLRAVGEEWWSWAVGCENLASKRDREQ